jgi:hypothetical protein
MFNHTSKRASTGPSIDLFFTPAIRARMMPREPIRRRRYLSRASIRAEVLNSSWNRRESSLHEPVAIIGLCDPLDRVEDFGWVVTVRDAFARPRRETP